MPVKYSEQWTVDGAAPDGLKLQRCQLQRDCHNARKIDMSGPDRTLILSFGAAMQRSKRPLQCHML